MRKKTYQRKPDEACAHCGAKVHSGGPAPKLGKRYCSKPDCRSARDAAKYLLLTGAVEPPPAPTKCSRCQEPLPPRKVRRGDSPLGRWCRRAKCLEHRRMVEEAARARRGEVAEVEQVAVVTADELRQAQDKAAFAEAALDPERYGECKVCGNERAIIGFIHPFPYLDDDDRPQICAALGDRAAPRALAHKIWPDLIPAPA